VLCVRARGGGGQTFEEEGRWSRVHQSARAVRMCMSGDTNNDMYFHDYHSARDIQKRLCVVVGGIVHVSICACGRGGGVGGVHGVLECA